MREIREGSLLPTLGEMWRSGAAQLRKAGVEAAEADAELLLLHVAGIGKAELLRDLREPWADSAERFAAWEELLRRRGGGVPVQYLTGEQYFYGRRFAVEPGVVLIPRPETELLAEAVLEAVDRLWAPGGKAVGKEGRIGPGVTDVEGGPGSSVVVAGTGVDAKSGGGPVVVDIGTGSGALAVTLAAERPHWRVYASDLSPDALAVARRNAAAHEVENRIHFKQGDLLVPFVQGPPIDVLVSNPPYIASSDLPGLQREVRDHEPHLALDGGEDGLAPYRTMAAQLRLLPQMPRLVAWEVGAGQAEEVAELLRAAAEWSDIRYVVDYAGIRRHVIAERA